MKNIIPNHYNEIMYIALFATGYNRELGSSDYQPKIAGSCMVSKRAD